MAATAVATASTGASRRLRAAKAIAKPAARTKPIAPSTPSADHSQAPGIWCHPASAG